MFIILRNYFVVLELRSHSNIIYKPGFINFVLTLPNLFNERRRKYLSTSFFFLKDHKNLKADIKARLKCCFMFFSGEYFGRFTFMLRSLCGCYYLCKLKEVILLNFLVYSILVGPMLK